MIEEAWARPGGAAVLLALDWAKAFDSATPASLFKALDRFGIPAAFIEAVADIYSNRSFCVRDAGVQSDMHPQKAGICQGCPLSPFLFVILMTILISDAKQELRDQVGIGELPFGIEELLYADDTLLIDTDGQRASEYMRITGELG